LPVPDYDDYFDLLNGFDARHRFFPTLPVEASRGCWWHRQDARGHFRGCAFCNLNLQWRGYRTKRPDQVIREVDEQVRRHQVLSLAFADNAFPINHAAAIFEGIRELGRDMSIFTELRADTSPALLRKMQQAGVDTVQVGIEALSTALLAKMNKGARAIDNLCLMKQCEALGIVNASNLMLHFPGSDDTDVNRYPSCPGICALVPSPENRRFLAGAGKSGFPVYPTVSYPVRLQSSEFKKAFSGIGGCTGFRS
jgi:radical SAM superfamily enzyme YgiQ (UPF0313 family)